MFSETVTYWVSHYGYAGLFTLLLLGIVGLPVPDEMLLVYAGFLVHKGELAAVPTFLTAFGGSVCGITLSYLLGRSGGWFLIAKYGKFVHLTPERVDGVHKWFHRIGKWLLVIGYFLIGVRHLTALAAGSSRLEWRTFALFAYSGAFVWSLTFLSLGWWLGHRWHSVAYQVHKHLLLFTIGLAAAIAVYIFVRKKFLPHLPATKK